jgi:hypothetical protein
MYHYKTNAILATLILGFNSASILDEYKQNFKYLAKKGLQTNNKHHGQSSYESHKSLPYTTASKYPTCRTPQSLHQCQGMGHLDVQESVLQCAWHNRR